MKSECVKVLGSEFFCKVCVSLTFLCTGTELCLNLLPMSTGKGTLFQTSVTHREQVS